MNDHDFLVSGFTRRSALAAMGAGIASLSLTSEALAQGASQITFGLGIGPTGLFFDPGNTPGTGAPLLIQYALHDGLIRPMRGTNSGLSLAEHMEKAKDGLAFTFRLREGLTFQNGDPITAEDAKFSFDRYKGANNNSIRNFVEKAEVLDKRTVRYVLKEQWPDFLTVFGTPASGVAWILPKAYFEKVGEQGFLARPVGAGPYRITNFTPGTRLEMEAYKGYWRKKPIVDKLIMKVIPDATTRLAAIQNGEIDITWGIQGDLIHEARKNSKLRIENAQLAVTNFIVFTSMYDKASPWSNEKVRQAANLAVDREGIKKAAYADMGYVSSSIIPHIMDFYWAPPQIPYDPKKAKALLAEAGFPNGFDGGEFLVSPDEALTPFVQSNLAAVGIKVRLKPAERAAQLQMLAQKKVSGLALTGSGAPGNASTRLQQFVASAGSLSYIKDPELDAAIAAQAKETNEAKRKEMLFAIQKKLYDHSMFMPVIEFPFPVIIGPRIDYAGVNGVPGNPYTAPYEDMSLKKG